MLAIKIVRLDAISFPIQIVFMYPEVGERVILTAN